MKIKKLLLTGWLGACVFTMLSAQDYDVYISDAGNFNNGPWQILKFDQNGENGVKFVTSNLGWPQDIFFIESENVMLVTNLNTGNIARFNATTGAYIDNFATGIGGPTRMGLGADGFLYVLQWTGNGKVLRYNLDGTLHDEFTAVGVPNSIGLDWDTDGNLYVTSYNGNYVKKFSPTGEDLGNFISSGLNGPTNIYFDDNGNLMVLNWTGGQVKRFNSSGVFIENVITGVPWCEGVDFLPDGGIMMGVGQTHAIKTYDANYALTGDFVPPSTLGLLTPNAVVFRQLEPSATQEVFREITFVTPTVGVQFQVSNPDPVLAVSVFEVFDSVGQLVTQIEFADGKTWDASNLAEGIYYLRATLPNGVIASQKVMVQR